LAYFIYTGSLIHIDKILWAVTIKNLLDYHRDTASNDSNGDMLNNTLKTAKIIKR